MAIEFSPNRRAGSKAVLIVLLTIERPVSWSVLVPGNVTPQIPRVNFIFYFFFWHLSKSVATKSLSHQLCVWSHELFTQSRKLGASRAPCLARA